VHQCHRDKGVFSITELPPVLKKAEGERKSRSGVKREGKPSHGGQLKVVYGSARGRDSHHRHTCQKPLKSEGKRSIRQKFLGEIKDMRN